MTYYTLRLHIWDHANFTFAAITSDLFITPCCWYKWDEIWESIRNRAHYFSYDVIAQPYLIFSGYLTKPRLMLGHGWVITSHVFIPPETKFRGGILDSPCSSVRLSVRPSVRPWVGVRMITLILFSGFKIIFFTYITWVKILHGIEYQRPTSLNMRILADHVTYSFLAFPKSIFS